jgi:hypothetical protein
MPDVCDDDPGVPRQTNRLFIARHNIWRSVGQRENPVLQKIQSYIRAAQSFRGQFSVHTASTRHSSDAVQTSRTCSHKEVIDTLIFDHLIDDLQTAFKFFCQVTPDDPATRGDHNVTHRRTFDDLKRMCNIPITPSDTRTEV